MNPSSNETSGIQLPPPAAEQAPANGAAGEVVPGSAEQAPAGAERAGAAPTSGAQAMPMPTSIPLPTPPTMPAGGQQNDVSATTKTINVQTADDGDLIEKEWVDKAKAIVARNRDDPYKQNEELTVVKADYMQKRYNKVIKSNK